MEQVDRFDIVIVGGGLTGAALALALADSPHRVALLERQPPAGLVPEWDSRIYAFSPGNVDWLRGLGGWTPDLRAQAVYAMRIFGDAGGHLTYDALQAGLPDLAWIAENSRVVNGLWRALAGHPQVSLISGQPEAVVWGGDGAHSLRLADGRRLQARLLVGADGAQSWLRTQAGIEIDVDDYHQSGVVANFETERPHRGIAWQWFRDDGVLAYLPLPGRRISIVWSSREDLVPDRLAMPAAEFEAAVAEAGGQALGRLTMITPQAAFPLKRRRAREWVRPGLVLIGDAAHTVHPLAGQGVNLGFRDARLLARTLADGGNPGEIGRLTAYATQRVEDVASMQWVTGGLKGLFNDAGLGWLRNTGLSLTDSQNWLKQALMRHAVQ